MSEQQSNLPALTVVNGKPTAISSDVAKAFGKVHRNIMRDIESMDLPEKWRVLNFEQTQIEHKMPTGGIRKDKAYLMTRDGFTILAMGFTGKKAMEFKIKYIEAFNRMEASLRESRLPARREIEGIDFPVSSLRWRYEKETGVFVTTPAGLADLRRSPLEMLLTALEKSGYEVSGCRAQLRGMASVLIRVIEIAADRKRTLDTTGPIRLLVS